MSITRFAGNALTHILGEEGKQLFKEAVVPKGVGEWVARLGTDIGFGILGGAMAPGDILQKLGAMGEQVVANVGISGAGDVIGAGWQARRLRNSTLPAEEKVNQVRGAAGIGGLATGTLASFAPLPYTNRLYAQQGEAQQREIYEQGRQSALQEASSSAPPQLMTAIDDVPSMEDLYRRQLLDALQPSLAAL